MVSLPRTADIIMHLDHYQGKTAHEAFQPLVGLGYTARSVVDHLLLGVAGTVLGIAVGQKSLLLAEVVAKGDRYAVSHCAEFVFPEGQSLSTPR